MRTFAIITLGCKVNQYESQQIRQFLESNGLRQVDPSDGADLIVTNTCCITALASSKSRQAIRKALRNNKNTTLVVAGCLPASPTDELGDIGGNIHIVGQKNHLGHKLNALISENSTEKPPEYSKPFQQAKIKHKSPSRTDNTVKLDLLRSYSGQSRAFVKIQDGCDGFCTYCIVPTIRTKLKSKPEKALLKEVFDLVYAGHREIVLTGIFLGAYGQETVRRWKWDEQRKNLFAKLLDKIASVDGLERVRLSSLEPADVTDELIEVFCKHRNIMPHLHLPLQSGSNSILKKMCRQYNIDEILETTEILEKKLDRPAITTDIIVGFPGETEKDFEDTIAVAKKVGFAKMHVFSFSPRKNTPAYSMDNKLAPEVIKERSKILRQLDDRLQKKFRKKFAEEQVGVIIEDAAERKGRCERYFMVHFDGEETLNKGQIVYGTLNKDGKTAKLIR